MVRIKLISAPGIYQIQSTINGKRYIGSAINLKSRKNSHISTLKRIKHSNILLQRYVNRYGLQSLKFGIIEFCSREKLIEREQYWIDTLWPEFNVCQIAGSSLGTKLTLKTIQRLREANSRPIDQYTVNGKFIASYSSRREAGRLTGINLLCIGACINNKLSSAGGFLWVVEGGSINKKLKEVLNKFKGLSTNVYQYNLNGDYLSSYNSIKIAAERMNTGPSNISSCAHGRSKTAAGFIWKFN